MKPIVNIASNAARRAGNLLVREFDHRDSDKTAQQFTQQARLQTEDKIVYEIQRVHADHQIILPNKTIEADNTDTHWHIDVLDGEENFAHRIPHFAIVIVIEVNGRAEHCLIHDPLLDETFTASRGDQATINNRRIRISKTDEIDQAIIAGQSDTLQMTRRTGCHSLMLAYTACGRYDAYRDDSLSPIVLQAGSLLIKTAGGLYCDWSGGNDCQSKKQLLAANAKLLKQLIK